MSQADSQPSADPEVPIGDRVASLEHLLRLLLSQQSDDTLLDFAALLQADHTAAETITNSDPQQVQVLRHARNVVLDARALKEGGTAS